MKHHVDPVIASRDWARVDLLGGKSLRFVAKKQEGISKLHGSHVPIERAGKAPVIGVPIYHPSYLRRWGQSMKPDTVNDLKSVLGQPPQPGN
jgi:uracil-DNA glycosylase